MAFSGVHVVAARVFVNYPMLSKISPLVPIPPPESLLSRDNYSFFSFTFVYSQKYTLNDYSTDCLFWHFAFVFFRFGGPNPTYLE
jgi:hypothetical protein